MNKQTLKHCAWLSVLMVTPLTLQGCIPLLFTGVAATTATVVTDRRTTGNIVNDELIEKKIQIRYSEAKPTFETSHINVMSYDGKVLLIGEVPNEATKRAAEEIAKNTPDVNTVVNQLAVMPSSSIGDRLSDSLLATKVRTTIIGQRGISLNQMKVGVERGIVYLMGVVTEHESKMTTDLVSHISGVQEVVTVFTIETPDQIRERFKEFTEKPYVK